jgi:hypothetical protein
MGDRCSWGTHEPAAQVIIKAINKASDTNAVASCRKVQHTSFFFMIPSLFDLKSIINTSLTICIDNHLLTLISTGPVPEVQSRRQRGDRAYRSLQGGWSPLFRSKSTLIGVQPRWFASVLRAPRDLIIGTALSRSLRARLRAAIKCTPGVLARVRVVVSRSTREWRGRIPHNFLRIKALKSAPHIATGS